MRTLVRDVARFTTEADARADLPEDAADLPYRGAWRQGPGDGEVPVHVFTDDPGDPADWNWIPAGDE